LHLHEKKERMELATPTGQKMLLLLLLLLLL